MWRCMRCSAVLDRQSVLAEVSLFRLRQLFELRRIFRFHYGSRAWILACWMDGMGGTRRTWWAGGSKNADAIAEGVDTRVWHRSVKIWKIFPRALYALQALPRQCESTAVELQFAVDEDPWSCLLSIEGCPDSSASLVSLTNLYFIFVEISVHRQTVLIVSYIADVLLYQHLREFSKRLSLRVCNFRSTHIGFTARMPRKASLSVSIRRTLCYWVALRAAVSPKRWTWRAIHGLDETKTITPRFSFLKFLNAI